MTISFCGSFDLIGYLICHLLSWAASVHLVQRKWEFSAFAVQFIDWLVVGKSEITLASHAVLGGIE